jgi:hypothetical protein
MLKLKFTCGVSILILINILMNFCKLKSLLPNLSCERCEIIVGWNLTKWIWHFWQELVEVHFPVLIFVLHSILEDTLIIMTCHKHFLIFEYVN